MGPGDLILEHIHQGTPVRKLRDLRWKKTKYIYVVENCFKILAEGLRKERLSNKPNLEDLPEAANPHPSLNSRCNLNQVSPIIALSAHLFLCIVAQAPSSLLLDYILGFKFYLSSYYNKTGCLLPIVL